MVLWISKLESGQMEYSATFLKLQMKNQRKMNIDGYYLMVMLMQCGLKI
jgi:hypothetical protein